MASASLLPQAPLKAGARVLITGGAGFIGSTLCARLLPDHPVTVLDNLRRNALAATGLTEHPNLRLMVGDVRDPEVVREAVADADYIVHMASIAGVDTVQRNPVLTMEVSIMGTMNILQAALQAGRAERVIDFSTSEVFGSYAYKVQEADVTSLGAVGEARWTYAVSKLATEHLALNYYKQYGLPTCSIRPFNIYGPRQVGEGAVHAFVTRALANQVLRIHNEGSQIRAWCYVDDIVDGVMRALTSPRAVGEAFNIGNARSTVTIYQLAVLIKELAGSASPIEFVEWHATDVELRIPDIRKARELLGFAPVVDLKEGLSRTLAWYRSVAA